MSLPILPSLSFLTSYPLPCPPLSILPFRSSFNILQNDTNTHTQGKLGAQAHVEDVEGTWRELTDVGNQGKLGGEATVPDVEGIWFELVTNLNRMCLSLTDQVRSIATVTPVMITIQAEGEINTLKDSQSDGGSGAVFASEVTRVAVEVGTAGKLGGQAKVEGTWKDLTDNVNKMASNLTWQACSISWEP
ncbi:hypothetical protein C8F04DRAFT_1397511 [Mycena alexandri]|uniref:Uncharacterized protein n=1 Tax=Mycena alexandri TaxID=1745969 RepID=A0AAD6X056_9AGAR|nr:hypothetical protein C8F04DRAFT_1397511 [Mycena alexandri]